MSFCSLTPNTYSGWILILLTSKVVPGVVFLMFSYYDSVKHTMSLLWRTELTCMAAMSYESKKPGVVRLTRAAVLGSARDIRFPLR